MAINPVDSFLAFLQGVPSPGEGGSLVYLRDGDADRAQCVILADVIIVNLEIRLYRVSGLSCPEAGGCKPDILRGFLDVFSLFGP